MTDDPLDQLADQQTAAPDALGAAEKLGALWDIAPAGIWVRGARIYGRGRSARVEIDLSNRETMTFREAQVMMRAPELRAEIVACTGRAPKVSADKAIAAYALIRALADQEDADDDRTTALEWCSDFLQDTPLLDCDMRDMPHRRGAFEQLNYDLWSRQREHGGSLASHALVLRDHDASRLVRAGWFLAHVRQRESNIGQAEISRRVLAVGWKRAGGQDSTSGRIKATSPARGTTPLAWNFYLVPATWEAP